MELLKDRPAYIRFETRAEEDRKASLAAEHYVAKDVHYVLITPAGSKDVIEREVSSWFAAKAQEVEEGRFPIEWLENYRRQYDAWKANEAIPEQGLSLKNWPLLSPSQMATLLNLNLRTVEDVAGANEESIRRIGMGGRALVEKAKFFLQTKAGSASTERLAALEVANENLRVRNESLEAQLRELAAKVDAAGLLKEAPEPAAAKVK